MSGRPQQSVAAPLLLSPARGTLDCFDFALA
jgi:hypothetical protein